MSKDSKMLECIANWIVNGFTRGHYPYWELSFNNIQHNELSTETLGHIGNAVADGYLEGEIVEDSHNNGWWKIKF